MLQRYNVTTYELNNLYKNIIFHICFICYPSWSYSRGTIFKSLAWTLLKVKKIVWLFIYFFKQMWGQRNLWFQVLIVWAKKESAPTLLGNPICPGSSDPLSCWFDIPGNWDVFVTGEIPNCLTKPKAFDLSRLISFII